MWLEDLHPIVTNAQQAGYAIAKTVAIPSPVPATGLILVGKTTGQTGVGKTAPLGRFYIRVVVFPHPRHTDSFYFDGGDMETTGALRAVGYTDEEGKSKIIFGEELEKRLGDAKKKLIADPTGKEVALIDDSDAYVAHIDEHATIRVRIDIMTTASKAREPRIETFCPICPPPPPCCS